MRGTLLLIVLLVPSVAAARTPRKSACDLVSAADVEAALGISPLQAVDPALVNRSSTKPGEVCLFEKPGGQLVLQINIEYTDAPDHDRVTKWLEMVDTKTYFKARPASGLGDAAFYTGMSPAAPQILNIFVGGTMFISLGHGTDDQLRTLATKALGGTGATGFVYTGVVPTMARPAAPAPNTASVSPLDELKSALTKKADAGDVRAEEALATFYRFSDSAKPDYGAAMYWYKRASDHGVARASYQLALMYRDGIGGPLNDDAAQALLTKAADAGYVPAMVPLAFLYAAKPDFVSKRRASGWALKAAEADDPEGHLVAGYLWDKGLLSFDDVEAGRNALAEYQKAADRGNCIAMMNTGGLYFNGRHRIRQDAAQAQSWFDRAQACLGEGFEDLRQKATRYRALAAAGRLPVPEVPPPPPAGSKFFTRDGQPLTALQQAAGVMLAITAVSMAYRIAHPEIAAQQGPDQGGGGAVDVRGDPRDDYGVLDLQNDIHNQQMQQQVYSGGCRPPVGCF